MGLISCPDQPLGFSIPNMQIYKFMFVYFIYVFYSFFYALFLPSTFVLPFFPFFTLLSYTSAFQLLKLSSFVYYYIFIIYAFSLCCFSLTSLRLVFYLHLSQLYSLYFYPFFLIGTNNSQIDLFIFQLFFVFVFVFPSPSSQNFHFTTYTSPLSSLHFF